METGNILIFQPGAGTINLVILYAECRYAECCYAECRYAECRYAECRYAECRYAECRGAVLVFYYFVKIFHKMLYPNLGL
jgi:hypothetical protein